MDAVQIPPDQVTPMEEIAEGVVGLRIAFVNVFAVMHGNRSWTLIDAGLPFSQAMIRNWAEERFSGPPNAIVLTHGHFDHVGAGRDLANGWDVPVFAHPLEHPYLNGQRAYPKPDVGAGGGLMTLLSPLYPRDPIDLGPRLQALPEPGAGAPSPAVLPGWTVVPTPGHTPGHVSLFRESDRVLLVGDAFCTTKPESFFEAALAQKPELHGPPAYFTWNWGLARESVVRLAQLNPSILAPGHGKTLAGSSVGEALKNFAANFDEVAVPENRC